MGPKAIDRMLALEPPREPLDSLAAVWRDFKWRRLERGHRDPCIKFTAESKDLREAITRACDSRGADGKLFFHQGRVWQVNRDAYAKALLRVQNRKRMTKAESFHEVWEVCSIVGGATHGIGTITTYDVAARLCAYLGWPARRIYLHGGVVDGCRSIGLNVNRRPWIERRELPPPLRFVENLDYVEDFLCGYRILIDRIGD